MTALSQDCLLDGKFADGKGLVNIHGGRYMRCAALKQAKLDRTDLLELQPILEVIRKAGRKTAELSVAEAVGSRFLRLGNKGAVGVVQSLGDRNKHIVLVFQHLFDILGKGIEVKITFGEVDEIGTATVTVLGRKRSGGGEPAGVSAHYLNYRRHFVVVNIGVLVYLHTGGGDEFCGAAEAGAMIRAKQVVVNGLRNAYNAALVSHVFKIAAYLVAGIHRIVATVIEKVANVVLFKDFEYALILRVILFVVLDLIAAGAKLRRRCVKKELEFIFVLFAHVVKFVIKYALNAVCRPIDLRDTVTFKCGFDNAVCAGVNNRCGTAGLTEYAGSDESGIEIFIQKIASVVLLRLIITQIRIIINIYKEKLYIYFLTGDDQMPLVTTTEMFEKAYKGGYAIGAFNVNNMEIVQGITEAAAELNAPLILQVSKGARAYANHTYLMKLVEAAVIETGLPIALHLDHGDSFELCKSCIDGGFTSVMIDASSKSFEDNIALTRQVVEYAHDHGVVVEAELGTLAGIEDEVKVSAEDSSYTRPEDVQEFVERTGCDSLAIAIGTSHGAYKFKPGTDPKLRFDILEDVERRLPGFPIVLHGSSSVPQEFVRIINENGGNMPGAIGVPEDQLRKAASMAVCKINIDSDLRLAMTASIRKYFNDHPDHFDPRQYLKPARAAIKDMVAHKIVDVLGCDGKA